MVKLFKRFGTHQNIAFLICILFIISAIAIGQITKASYQHLSDDPDITANARLYFSEDDKYTYDYYSTMLDFDEAVNELNSYEYIFLVEVINTQSCYLCELINAHVVKTIKGNVNEDGNDIILYQWSSFQIDDRETLSLRIVDQSLPIKENKRYLVFARKKNYCKEYQSKLKCNEYSIELQGMAPTVYVVNETQKSYLNFQTDKTFASVSDKYYICFSQEALDNLNNTTKKIIEYFIKP